MSARMSHVVLTCTCKRPAPNMEVDRSTCPVPGHGQVPPDPVDVRDLAAAGREAVRHLGYAVDELMKARAAWVSRGLPADNPFPSSLDDLAQNITYQRERMMKWTAAAGTVVQRRTVEPDATPPPHSDLGATPPPEGAP